jgi:hypothetical protein
MKRPVRPVALLILTLCALYPGLSSVFQGFYPWVTGQEFALMGQMGAFVDLPVKMGMATWVPHLLKGLIGLAWLAGVPGLWVGEGKAVPLVALGALGSLILGPGPAAMGVVGLICLFGFRETEQHQPA